MDQLEIHKASCLCGSIQIEAALKRLKFTACHCNMCRKWGGTWMAVEAASLQSITNKTLVSVYESSAWANRAFCSRCGTHLYYHVDRDNEYYIPVGLFEDGINFEFKRQIYIDQKPDYYCFADETQELSSDMLEVADARDDGNSHP